MYKRKVETEAKKVKSLISSDTHDTKAANPKGEGAVCLGFRRAQVNHTSSHEGPPISNLLAAILIFEL
jgi:hypothetical protein